MSPRTIQSGISQVRFIPGNKHRLYIGIPDSHNAAQMKTIHYYYYFFFLSQPLLKFQQAVLLVFI